MPGADPILRVGKIAARFDLAEAFTDAIRQPGQSGWRLFRQIMRCRFNQQKLNPQDFFFHGLHRPGMTEAERLTHLNDGAVTRLNGLLNGPRATNDSPRLIDKLVAAGALADAGLPTAGIRAVYQAGPEPVRGKTLRSAVEIAEFLLMPGQTPCFGKPVFGSLSVGIVSVESATPDGRLVLGNGRTVNAAALASEVVTRFGEGYVFQDLLRAAPTIRHLSGPVVPTLRVCSLWLKDEPVQLYAGLRLPAPGDMSDESGAGGGARLHLDMETGTVIRTQDMARISGSAVANAPVTGQPLLGQTVPDWPAMLDLARKAHRVFHRQRIVGIDIAVSDRGLVVNEVNSNPLQTNYQVGTGEGILNDRFRPLFRAALAENGITGPRRGAPWPYD